jgi:hypothetical protein
MERKDEWGPLADVGFLDDTLENLLMTNVYSIKIPNTHYRVGKASMGKNVADDLHSQSRPYGPAPENKGC